MIRAAFFATVSLFLACPAFADTQVVLAGSLIADAATGPTGPATITVTDGRITAIAKGMDQSALPADAAIIDLSTKTVLPGLIAVASNPLDDIRTLEKVDWVMVRGRVIQ